jgi:hypothetical protein
MWTNIFFSTILLLWAGMILGISCLEAWVKFRTPNLSKEVGLEVGRTVFSAFHTVQWYIAVVILAIILFHSCFIQRVIVFELIVLLALQSFWLMPRLNTHINAILNKSKPRSHYDHLWYMGLELIKLISLLIIGVDFIIVN